MTRWLVYGMIYGGSFLMIYNICGFIRFARYIKHRGKWGKEARILHIPIVLLILFLLGYLGVGFFGRPDMLVAGILFGGSVFVFVIYRLLFDITRHIIANEQLEAELRAAEESSRVKSSFLASISHEMRTPMNVILGLDTIALKNPDLSPQTRLQLEKIGQSGKHLLGLINNTLDLHQIETGELTVKNEEFSLPEALDQVDAIVQTLCEKKGLQYHTTRKESMAAWYLGDEMLLKQILLSILDNAVKFTDAPGRVTLTASKIFSDGDEHMLQFTVSDTGIGMSPSFLPKVLDLFSQEDASSTSRYGGSGLGLAIAKNKVNLMGGNIAVTSKKNVGTTFTVTIPLKVSPKAAATTEQQPEMIELEGRRVLIVDDVEENAEIAADLLELEGAESDHAQNGLIALVMFQQSPENYYDAVLMDLRMPVMDGLESARRIRSLERQDAKTVPILALTANAFESDVQHSMEAGMNAHLVKPVDADLLYTTLKQCIRQIHI